MRSQIKLGRIAGIEIGLHYSWVIIATLIALSLSAHFHSVNPNWSFTVIWSAAIVTAILFFATLLLHELAHSIVAKASGLRVRAVTLFALGGVSQIESESPTAQSEFMIAIIGPITSAVIGLFCTGLARLGGWAPSAVPETPALAVLMWLGYINFGLALFNMIPGYPLDGGRVLRSVIWWITAKQQKATRAAARIGQVVAFLFILYGLYQFFFGASFGGLWIAFIGWFLLDAARGSYVQVAIMADLRSHRVADIMERDCSTVAGQLSLRDFVDHHLLHSASRCFPVVQNDHFAGLITPKQVRQVGKDEWSRTSLQSVMLPAGQLRAVPPDMPAIEALDLMARENLNQLVVVSDDKLQGIFSREQVVRFLQLYSGLGSESRDLAA